MYPRAYTSLDAEMGYALMQQFALLVLVSKMLIGEMYQLVAKLYSTNSRDRFLPRLSLIIG
jgi:hypothetical protein